MIDEMIVQQARETNLVDLIGQRVELHKESSTEWAGPCPRCGGHDRLHVKATGFFCRNRGCWPDGSDKFGDAIAYVRWLHGTDFAGAVAMLTGGVSQPVQARVAPQPTPVAPRRQHDGWADKVEAMVCAAFADLGSAESYLAGRGLTLSTAALFGLGYRSAAPLPNTWDAKARRHIAEPQPALVIPWHRGGKVVAVRYRFLDRHTYTDLAGQQRTVKLSSVYDSDFRDTLYGGQMLPDYCHLPIDDNGKCAEQLRTLVLCEGELNAMSIWQATNALPWDVLSIGSESQRIPPAGVTFAERYGRVIVWTDKADAGKRLMSQIAGAIAITSPVIGDREHDANDMLRTGQLFEFLMEARRRACQSDEERERVKWDLWEVNRAASSD